MEKSSVNDCLTDTSPILFVKIKSEMVLVHRRNDSFVQTIKSTVGKVGRFCFLCALIVCLILLVLSLLAVIFKPKNRAIHVLLVDFGEPLRHVTNERFLSVAIDSEFIARDFRDCNLSDPKLIKLMIPLAPGYLRIGGTMADRLIFASNSTRSFKIRQVLDGENCLYEDEGCDFSIRDNFTMNGDDWLLLNKIAEESEFTILFDLNVLRRNDDGSWNSTNAKELLDFSASHNLDVIWELGNEPNSFRHVFNYEVNATQLAKDFIKLREILSSYSKYANSLIVGPDTTRPQDKHKESQKYLQEFLKEARDVVNAITWHQYYFSGKTAKVHDFLNPDIFDVLYSQINTTKAIAAASGLDKMPIWLGETSSAYSSGAPQLSDRYIATFIWLDKLGVAAKAGLDLVVRQSLFQGHYALVDTALQPNPDWWVSVLYKMLVGPEVVTCYDMLNKYVRLYCHCTNKSFLMPFSMTVFGINMKHTEAKIKIQGIPAVYEDLPPKKLYAYILTPYANLRTKYILLNNQILRLFPDGSLPLLLPKIVDLQPYLIMPPFSLVFWVIPTSGVHCTRNGTGIS